MVTVFVLTKVPSTWKNPDIIINSVPQTVFIFACLSFVISLGMMQWKAEEMGQPMAR